MNVLRAVQWLVAAGMLFSALHGLVTGSMRVKGAGTYTLDGNPGGFRFMVVTHVIGATLLGAMAWMGIPP